MHPPRGPVRPPLSVNRRFLLRSSGKVRAVDLDALLLPALFSGMVAIFVTRVIERLGGLLGGIVGTLPTTIVPAAIGIWDQSHDVEGFRQAMYGTPPAMFLSALFLASWKYLPPRLPAWPPAWRLGIVITLSLCAWCLGASMLVLGLSRSGASALLAVAATVAIPAVGLWAMRHGEGASARPRRIPATVLLARGAGAALAIFCAVWIARMGGGLAAGVAAVFPAIFLTTMVALSLAHGDAVTAGAVGPMMVGSTSVAVFALTASLALPVLGPWRGTPLAWCVATLGAQVPLFFLARRVARTRPMGNQGRRQASEPLAPSPPPSPGPSR